MQAASAESTGGTAGEVRAPIPVLVPELFAEHAIVASPGARFDLMGNMEGTLSRRELEVAQLVAEGLTNRQIAARLFIAERTAEGHVEQIRNKLGFSSRSQIAALMAAGTQGGLEQTGNSKRRSNLPTPPGELVGREQEITELADLVARRRGVVTLTGPGGIGKTRLALAVAARLDDQFADGIWFVDLAPLRDPEHVASSVARALGLKPQVDRPLVNTIAASLANRSALLVVDNFEHMIEAGTVLTEILRSSPDSAILVTSREALRLYGEQEYPVPALAVGQGSKLGSAVQLFIARAREIEPRIEFGLNDLAAIRTVCERLDGLPLAIELAAAKVRVLSPSTMLERLQTSLDVLRSGVRDVPPRHQALAATFEWSHELLNDEEQVLFRRLAAFTGGFTLEAAEAVAAGDRIATDDVMELLDSLAAKSLIRREDSAAGARFRMLETIGDFARAKLKLSPEAKELKLAHMRYFRDFAEREAPRLKSQDELVTLARLDAEQSNLRSSIESAREVGDGESELRIIGGLWLYWCARGETHEGLVWLRGAPLDDERINPNLRAEAWIGAARLNMSEGHAPRAAQAGRKLLELAPSCAVPGRVMGWAHVAMCHERFDEPERVQSLTEEALRFMLESGDHWEKALAYTSRGEVARTFGSAEAAAAAYENAVRLLLDSGGELFLLGVNHHNLAQTALMLSDLEGAEAQFLKAFEAGRQIGASKLTLHSLVGLANVTRSRGRHVAAARMLGCADAAFARAGYELHPADQPPRDRLVNALRASLGDAAYEELHAQGSRMDPEEMAVTPEALEGTVS